MQDATSPFSAFYYGGLMKLAQTDGADNDRLGPRHRTAEPIANSLAHPTISSTMRWGECARSWLGSMARSVEDLISACPDPVWAMESEAVAGLWDLPAPRVAVNLRSHPLLTPDRLAVLTRALVEFQTATQVCLLLVPFQASQDLAIAETIQPQLPGVSKILTLENPQELKGVFRGVEMAIAMRFHGLIMAAAEGCRCCALSYDPKVTYLMDELGLPGWELADLPLDSHQISQAWLEIYANGEALSDDQIHSLVDRALMHQDVLRDALKKD